MTRTIRRIAATITSAITLIIAAAAFFAAPANAAPYQNWTVYNDNRIGIVWHPAGDYFDAWINITNNNVPTIFWRYDGATIDHMADVPHGKGVWNVPILVAEGRTICFWVKDWTQLSESPSACYRT